MPWGDSMVASASENCLATAKDSGKAVVALEGKSSALYEMSGQQARDVALGIPSRRVERLGKANERGDVP